MIIETRPTSLCSGKPVTVSVTKRAGQLFTKYKLHIDFNIDFEQFSMGLDVATIAA